MPNPRFDKLDVKLTLPSAQLKPVYFMCDLIFSCDFSLSHKASLVTPLGVDDYGSHLYKILSFLPYISPYLINLSKEEGFHAKKTFPGNTATDTFDGWAEASSIFHSSL